MDRAWRSLFRQQQAVEGRGAQAADNHAQVLRVGDAIDRHQLKALGQGCQPVCLLAKPR